MPVVVRDADRQHRLQMSSAHGQHPVKQLPTDRTDPPFSDRVWRLHGREQDPDALRGEDRIEGVGELRVPVTDEELELPDAVCQAHDQVAGLLGHPRPGRAGGHAQDVDTTGSKLDHEQHMQALEQDGVDVEEVAGQDSLGLRGQELPPSQPGAAGCRVDAGPLENQPHRAWRNLVPKPSQFSVDAAIPQVGFSAASRRARRRSCAGIDGRPGGRCGLVQWRLTRPPMPAQ